MSSKATALQIELFCTGCILRVCNEQSLHCHFRLYTKPNWMQKRQMAGPGKVPNNFVKVNARRKAIAALGFKKYDKDALAAVLEQLSGNPAKPPAA